MNLAIFHLQRKCIIAISIACIFVCFVGISSAQDFRIDNQLRIQANDCYTRIAIGSRMPDSAVNSTIPANLLSDCEAACSANRTICNAFSFGIDARGNGTCRIGRMDLNMRGNDLLMDPDYDVYERRAKMPRGCQHDRLLRIGFGARMPITNSSNGNNGTGLSRQQVNRQGNSQGTAMTMNGAPRRPQNPFGDPFSIGAMPGNDSPREASFFRGGWYAPIADDSDTRLYDIINNKKNYKSNQWRQPPHQHFIEDHHLELHSNGEIHEDGEHNDYIYRSAIDNEWSSELHDGNSKWTQSPPALNPKWNQDDADLSLKWIKDAPRLNSKWNEGFRDFRSKSNIGFPGVDENQRGILYSTPTIASAIGNPRLFQHGAGFGFLPEVTTVDPVLEKTKACYRKLLAGKRLADSHVRRNIQCSRIEECHRVCEYESTFVCEGFNYGRMQDVSGSHGERSYMCQLTSLSGNRMDLRRDFVQDPRYDYYERDWRCPAEKPAQGRNNWSIQRPDWHPPPPPPRPHRPQNDISRRPQRPNDRYPISAGPQTRPYYLPEKPRPPINRPSDYDYYSGPPNLIPQSPQNNVLNYHRPNQPPHTPPYLENPNYYYPSSNPTRPGEFSKFPDRRIDHYDWNRVQLEMRPNEVIPHRNWQSSNGQYLPNKDWKEYDIYGPSYGYDSNRYDGRFPDRQTTGRPGDLYPGDELRKPVKPQRRPGDQQDYYGYHYGPGYGYETNEQHGQQIDSYVPNSKPQNHAPQGFENWGGSRDCSVRSATGFKVARKSIDASFTTGNLEECEMLCASRGDCQSFAYRYSLAATAPTDNCLLSSVNFSKLNFYTDLVPDRDYDIYAIISGLRNCQGSRKPNTETRPYHRPPEECFWRIRSGFGIPVSLTRKELRVENGLGECQTACVNSHHFTCRSFVFRYESDRDRGQNCFLSDCPSSEIISEESVGLPRIDQAELYERGSYGRGCEPYPFATIYNPANFDKPKPWNGNNNHLGNQGDEGCYSGYQGGCRLSPYAVSSITRVDSETECRRKCSRMRNNPHSPCMSFSFKVGDEKRGDNCYLSDVSRKDLRPGLDYVYDDDYVMYAWKELEPQCASGPVGYPHNAGGYSWSGGVSSDSRPAHLGPGTGLLSYNYLVLGVRPLDPDRPDPVSPPVYSHSPSQNDHGYSPGFGSPYQMQNGNANGFASFNRHYTVNGLPCKRGTKCERNELVGFWSCEPEGSDLGSWDYCCEPNHHCGFSQGYRYPWCYVGPSEDQWRPCSDKYFPYLPSPRPAVRPNQHDHRRPNYHHPDEAIDNDHCNIYHSRHWPIAFLHPQPPPNVTTDSVALADDRRDDSQQRTNTSNDNFPTNKTRAPTSVEMTNSPITRLQLHKSNLKRRGLVSSNGTLLLSKNAPLVKKIRRITIVPADIANFAIQAPPYGVKYINEKPLETGGESNDNDGRTKTTRKNDDFDVIHLGATLQDIGSAKKSNGNLARVERVTKPTRGRIDLQTRRNNGGAPKEFDSVSS